MLYHNAYEGFGGYRRDLSIGMQRLPLHPGQRRLFPATACVDFYRFRRIPPEQRQNQDTIDAAMQIAYVLMHVSDLPLWFRLEPTHVSVVSGSSPSELVVAWPSP